MGQNGREKGKSTPFRKDWPLSSSAYALSEQEIPSAADSGPRQSGVSLSYVDCIWHVSLCDVCMRLGAGIHRTMFRGLGSAHYTSGAQNFVRGGWLLARNMAVSYSGRGLCCQLPLTLGRFTTDRRTHHLFYRTKSFHNTFVRKTARDSAPLPRQTHIP